MMLADSERTPVRRVASDLGSRTIAGQGESDLDFGIAWERFGPGLEYTAAVAIQFERALIVPSQCADDIHDVVHEESRSVDQQAAVLFGHDVERRQCRRRERFLDRPDERFVVGVGPKRRVRQLEHDLRSDALEPRDVFVADRSAVQAQIQRPDTCGEGREVEERLVQSRDLEKELGVRCIPVEREVAVAFLEILRVVTDGRKLRGERGRDEEKQTENATH